jgi:hypothetical protein
MQAPIMDSLLHSFLRLVTYRRSKIDEELSISVFGPSWSKRVPKKIKFRFWVVSTSVIVFAIDDTRFGWMEFKPTLLESFLQTVPKLLCVFLAVTVRYSQAYSSAYRANGLSG